MNTFNVDYNCSKYKITDDELDNGDLFKIVYTGSVRKVNNIDKLLNIAKEIRNPRIVFLKWGEGDQREVLENRVKKEKISNHIFKGYIEKKYVPYIISKADLNFAHNDDSPLFRFGISFNKLFEYMAAGRPILCDFPCRYNPVLKANAGVSVDSGSVDDTVCVIEDLASGRNLSEYARNARKAAELYDFESLSNKLIEIIEQII